MVKKLVRRMVKKSIRANFQKSATLLTATAANPAPSYSTKTETDTNKTAAQPRAGHRSAR
ncbi:MAG: hypothetical protein EBQ71_12160 [Betaproteobacteria bacterium]|nr:hypothetical protein [Betaproteobacteria bacterium]